MNINWRKENNKLIRDFEFQDFKEAIKFINGVAEIANNLDHHPEIYNLYNKVTLILSTHDAGDIVTEKDLELAKEIDEYFENFSRD